MESLLEYLKDWPKATLDSVAATLKTTPAIAKMVLSLWKLAPGPNGTFINELTGKVSPYKKEYFLKWDNIETKVSANIQIMFKGMNDSEQLEEIQNPPEGWTSQETKQGTWLWQKQGSAVRFTIEQSFVEVDLISFDPKNFADIYNHFDLGD